MNLQEKQELLKAQLQANMEQLEKTSAVLGFSINKCSSLPLREGLSADELEVFEALAARFARIADILTQKVLTTLFLLLKEPQRAFIDKAQQAEKTGIISSAADLIDIGDIRNDISHEYATDVIELFGMVLEKAPRLQELAREALTFSQTLLTATHTPALHSKPK